MGIINSRGIHNDGVGLFQYSSKDDTYNLWKNEKAPAAMEGWGRILFETVQTNDPVLMHVRNATMHGSRNVKIISEEKSHPFDSKGLVLAHNGTLELREDVDKKRYEKEELIDSEIFLEELIKDYDPAKKNFAEAMKESMGRFYGKFAFMVFDKINRQYFMVRGKTKTLYRLNIIEKDSEGKEKYIGFVVNTEKEDLVFGVNLFIQNVKSILGRDLYIENDEYTEIDQETIFEFNGKDFSKIGEVKEVEKYLNVNAAAANRAYNNGKKEESPGEIPFGKTTGGDTSKLSVTLQDAVNFGISLREFMDKSGMTLEEVEFMSLEVFNKPLSELHIDEIDMMVTDFFPNLEPHITKPKKEIWKSIKDSNLKYFVNSLQVYDEFEEIKFPYFTNTEGVLSALAAKLAVRLLADKNPTKSVL